MILENYTNTVCLQKHAFESIAS